MILITGGAGFIGSALVWGLNQEQRHDLVISDHLGRGDKWQNLARSLIDFVIPKDQLFTWLGEEKRPIEAIFHLGACSTTTERDADYLMENNVLFTQRLWNYCTQHGIPYFYASSAATYGAEEQAFDDQHTNVPKLLPINKYGWSKQLFDAWAIKQKKSPPAWFGFKFFNVYGPNEYHKGAQASVVYHAFPQVQGKSSLRLFKSYRDAIAHGDQRRDFVYVKDVVNVLLHFWRNSKKIPSGIYNLGTGQARSFKDLGQSVFTALDRNPSFDWIDMPEDLQGKYQYFTQADLTKLRETAGYIEPFYSLESGIEDYVRSYLNQRDRYLS